MRRTARHHGNISDRDVTLHTDCGAGEGRAAFTLTVDVSGHTSAACALINLPLFIRLIHRPLVHAGHPRVYKTRQTHTHMTCHCQCKHRLPFGGRLSYLGIRSSISLESSLASGRPDKPQTNTLQCCTRYSPAEERTNNRLLKQLA